MSTSGSISAPFGHTIVPSSRSTVTLRNNAGSERKGSKIGPRKYGSRFTVFHVPSVSSIRTRSLLIGFTAQIRIIRLLSIERSYTFQWLPTLRAPPVSLKLNAMNRSPFQNEGECAARNLAPQYRQRFDRNFNFVFSVLRVKMRRRMIIVVHRYYYTEKLTNARHDMPSWLVLVNIVSIWPVAVSARVNMAPPSPVTLLTQLFTVHCLRFTIYCSPLYSLLHRRYHQPRLSLECPWLDPLHPPLIH